MLFLGIDQHARQLTVSLRDQHGDVLLARQVSTQLDKDCDGFDPLIAHCLRGSPGAQDLLPRGAVTDEVTKRIRDGSK